MLSEILKDLRSQKKVTQDEMAQLLNIKRQTYSAYERGVSLPDIHALMKMAEFFGVSTDYLLGYSYTSDKQVIPPDLNALLASSSTLNKDDLKKVMEYIEFLKSKNC